MLNLSEIAAVLKADHVGPDARFASVSTDSRKVSPGALFIALRGERFNGCDFLPLAQQGGAVAAIVENRVEADIPLLVVEDARRALGQLAAFWRSRFDIPVIAITGSNGKTTVKEMLASILRELGEVLATRGNLNNDIGLPLTLLGLRPEHRFAVVEMGMNHRGEIAYLCDIAKPDIALVTNAASAHLAGLGSIGEVARAKGEIFEGMSGNGIALINADDAYAPLWRELAGDRRIIDFALSRDACLTAKYSLLEFGSKIAIRTPEGEVNAEIAAPGLHNVRNALAAAAAAHACGIGNDAIAAGLGKFEGVAGRMQRRNGRHGAILIDDTYNANPDSVKAAIAWLSGMKGRTVLILGDMGELGPDASKLHEAVGLAAKEAGIGALLTLGRTGRDAAESFGEGAFAFDDMDELICMADSLMGQDVPVLVKGSRFMKMERIVEKLEEKGAACS
ncbi:MAG: UDP-N-acetylmuramoyl-tripeptide--D-alanyl-D-alanine ligase [Burkholderiales bacterium]|nr:UDP-N-acetylmuramoyl-tripeptide--D-alanyl-D-alanine ligase [Burkholderiales bacterium]